MQAVIIGAGLLGLTTAYYLRRHAVDVMVIDRAGGPGMETSFANACIIHCSIVDPWNAPGITRFMLQSWLASLGGGGEHSPVLLRSRAIPQTLRWGTGFLLNSRRSRYLANTLRNSRLANYSLDTLRQLRADTGINYGVSRDGLITAHRSQQELDIYMLLVEHIAQTGVRYELLDRRGLVAKEPALGPIEQALVGGVYFPNDEVGDAHLFCRELARVLGKDGVQFRFDASVSELRQTGDSISAALIDGDAVGADIFIVAAGSYTPQLLRPLGIRVPIAPAKGYSITVPMDGWNNRPHIPVGDHALHAGVTPLGDSLRVAGTAEFTGFDLTITPGRIDSLMTLLKQVYPELAARTHPADVTPWAGLRPMCPDGVPVISGTPLRNLFINSGHGHLGWTMAAGSGKVCADLVVGAPAALNMNDYALSRF